MHGFARLTAHGLGSIPKAYGDAVCIFIIAYYTFVFCRFTYRVWRSK